MTDNTPNTLASKTPKAWATNDDALTPKQREALAKDAAIRARLADEEAKRKKRKGGGRR
jgi:hypothetical protein